MPHPVNRHAPLTLSSELVMRNRVVVPAMASETADSGGFVTSATLSHYRRLAQAQPGLMLVEYSYVHRSGRSEPQQLAADTDEHIFGLGRVAEIIRQSGAIAGLQLTHAGGKTSRDLTDGRLMGPSGIAVPAKDRVLAEPDTMTLIDIDMWRSAFVAAAIRGVTAGFDLIELHAAHGYGLNQWLSPLTNQRLDGYGRDARGRARILMEIVAEIRRAAPSAVLSVRIPGQDHFEGGITESEALDLAKWLKAAGVTIINVSSGMGGWRRPSERRGEGYLVPDAALIQREIDGPVIGVGGIKTGRYIDEALAEGQFTLAAVGRAILENPAGWHESNLTRSTISSIE